MKPSRIVKIDAKFANLSSILSWDIPIFRYCPPKTRIFQKWRFLPRDCDRYKYYFLDVFRLFFAYLSRECWKLNEIGIKYNVTAQDRLQRICNFWIFLVLFGCDRQMYVIVGLQTHFSIEFCANSVQIQQKSVFLANFRGFLESY